MTVRFHPVPFQASNSVWWYHRTDRLTGEVRFAGPFDTKQQALDSIAADAHQTEHAMPIPDATTRIAARARFFPADYDTSITVNDEIMAMMAPGWPYDTTYSVKLFAEVDAAQRLDVADRDQPGRAECLPHDPGAASMNETRAWALTQVSPVYDVGPGACCEDCGHFARWHHEHGCRFPRPADNPCRCPGFCWLGVRYPRPWKRLWADALVVTP